jgi:hypothetical protein
MDTKCIAGEGTSASSKSASIPLGLSTADAEKRYAFTRFLYQIRKRNYPKLNFLQALFIQYEFGPHLPAILTLTGDMDNMAIGPTQELGPWTYTGEVLNGLRHGTGTCTWPDRKGGVTKYVGQWQHNLAHGTCLVTSARGYVYEGSYHSGIKHGRGKYVYTTGDVYECNYDQGQLHGKDRLTIAVGGAVHEREWQRGKMRG